MPSQGRSPCGWETIGRRTCQREASDKSDVFCVRDGRCLWTYGLDVVADLLGYQLGDVLDEGVLDADLVAVWREGIER